MDTKTATDLITRYMSAASAQDLDDLHQIFADDVAIEWPQSGEHFKGKEACINIFMNYPGGRPRVDGNQPCHGEDTVWGCRGQDDLPRPEDLHARQHLRGARRQDCPRGGTYFTEPFPVPEWRKQWTGTE
jgi:hypothetical protein